MRISRSMIAGVALGLYAASPVQAGMFEDVIEGLRFAGFDAGAGHSEITNTSTALVGTTFRGNVIDFGDFNLSLNGPVAAVVQLGGRRIPTFDLTLSTGRLNINPNDVVTVGPAEPLSYNLAFDSGTNTTDISGNMLMDARFSVNRFGSYDLRLQFSDRQTTTVDGHFDDTSPMDFNVDLGPVDIEGNIFSDVLAVITDPFFEAAGFENIFAVFSGRPIREQQAKSLVSALQAKIDAGGILTQDELATLTGMSIVAAVLGDDFPDLSFVSGGLGETGGEAASSMALSVPEPPTILLLIVAPLLRRRTRR